MFIAGNVISLNCNHIRAVKKTGSSRLPQRIFCLLQMLCYGGMGRQKGHQVLPPSVTESGKGREESKYKIRKERKKKKKEREIEKSKKKGGSESEGL